MTQDPIILGMLKVRDEIDKAFSPLQHAPYARTYLGAELETLRRLEGTTDWPKVRSQYLTIMALCYRALRDQNIETLPAAELKETRV